MNKYSGLTIVLLIVGVQNLLAQRNDTINGTADLQTCIQYALSHFPQVKEAETDEEIVRHEIRSRLADWYPQVNFDYSLQHYFKLQTSYFQGQATTIGVKNTSGADFSATQNLFNRDVFWPAALPLMCANNQNN